MAKCIKYYRPHGGHVVRVSDDAAAVEVRTGKATYCPKRWWKAALAKEAEESTK